MTRAWPHVGVGLPIFGPHATPSAVATVAKAADRLGFRSVSTFDRLLLPATPGWTNDFGLPEHAAYDALEALTWAAALTERVRLVTGVLNSLFHPPVVLARRYATLDQLSGGRVDVGIGSGWLPQEFAAVGVPESRRGAGFEEHLAVMRACWDRTRSRPTARATRSPANIGPKPVRGHLPVLIGGVAPVAIERAARVADGVILGVRDWTSAREQIATYRDAGGTGRVILRAGPLVPHPELPEITDAWTPAHIAEDLNEAAGLGVDEVIWDLNIVEMSIPEQLDAMESLASSLVR